MKKVQIFLDEDGLEWGKPVEAFQVAQVGSQILAPLMLELIVGNEVTFCIVMNWDGVLDPQVIVMREKNIKRPLESQKVENNTKPAQGARVIFAKFHIESLLPTLVDQEKRWIRAPKKLGVRKKKPQRSKIDS